MVHKSVVAWEGRLMLVADERYQILEITPSVQQTERMSIACFLHL